MARIVDIFAFLGLDPKSEAAFESQVVRTAQGAGDKAGASMGANIAAGVSRVSGVIGRTLSDVGKNLSSTGRSMTTSLTLPIVAAGAATVSLALDFDTAMRRIQGLAKVPEAEIAGVRDSVLQMAQDIGRSPQELAEAFYFVASAGFKADEALKVLEISARASASGMGETSDIAKVLGGTINAYGHENLTAAHAGDVLTAAIQDGAAEAADFASSIGMVVPNAAALGVSFDQVAAAMSAMTQVGVDAQTAAVNLGQIFSSLQKPTAEAEATLTDLGTSAEALRTELREKGLLATLRDLEARFAGNEEATAKVFGNIRALRGVTQLLGLDEEQLNGIFADTATALDTLSTAYDETDGPQRQLDKAMASLQVTAIELGADVLPIVVEILQQLAGGAKALAAWWKTLDDGTKRLIVQALAFVAVLGPMLFLIGKVTSGVGALFKVISFLSGAKGIPLLIRNFAGLARAARFAGLAMLAAADQNPFNAEDFDATSEALKRWGVTATDAAKAGLQIAQAQRAAGGAWLDISQQQTLLNEAIRIGATDLDDAVRMASEALSAAHGDIDQAIADMAAQSTAGTKNLLAPLVKDAAKIPGAVSAGLVDGQFKVGAAAETMVDPIDEAMQQAIADTAAAADDLISTLADSLATGPKEIQDEIKALRKALQDIYTTGARRRDIEEALGSQVLLDALKRDDPKIRAQAAETIKGLLEQYDLLAPGALERGKLVNPALKAGIQSNYQALLTYLKQEVVPGITDPFELADVLDEMGYSALAAYVRGMEQARRDKLSGALATLQGQMLREAKINLYPEGFESGTTYTSGLNDGIAAGTPAITGKVLNLLNILKMAGSPPYTHSREAGEGVGESWLQALFRSLSSGLQGIGGLLSGALAPSYAVPSLTGSAGYAASQGIGAVAQAAGGGGNKYDVKIETPLREHTTLEVAHELRRAEVLGVL